jgi:Flp pilus assembly protein TadG
MIVLFGVLAFAVDTGWILHVRTELQRTADACALAAAARLPDTSDATLVAHSVAAENNWSSGVKTGTGDELQGSDLDPLDVEFGRWDRDTATFTTPTPSGRSTNAVRVTLRRTEASKNPIRLFFGRVLGTSNADVSASAIAMYDRWLCGPFVGIEWLSVPGTPDTDSYDSAKGSYGGANIRERGSICSDGPIGVDGAAWVRGDARAGWNDGVTITGGAIVTGDIGTREKRLRMAGVHVPDTNDNDQIPMIPEGNSWKSPVDENGNFLLDGNKTIDLPPGTYCFNDVTLAGSAVLNFIGPQPTTIYITGNLYRGGLVTVTNSLQKSGNVRFLMTGGTAHVTSGNDFYGVIYAPNTAVTIDGSSDLYGAVVGKTLTITGSGAGHYDESLKLEEVEFPRRTTLVD